MTVKYKTNGLILLLAASLFQRKSKVIVIQPGAK